MKKFEGFYKLSHDVPELNRLDVQHRMWTLLIGDLYPSHLHTEVERLLTSKEANVLDVGCGSGIWVIEMAKRFPEARVVGIDRTSLKYSTPLPQNFSFEQRDFSKNLPSEYSRKFDVVHCRCVCQHVLEPQTLVNEMTQCLKPGGLLFLADGDWVAYDERKELLKPFIYDPSISIEENIINMGNSSCYAGWLRIFGDITRNPRIEFVKYWAPINWGGEEVMHGHEIGNLMLANIKEFLQTSEPAILSQGTPTRVVNAMKEGASRELNARFYNIWHYTSAVASMAGVKAQM